MSEALAALGCLCGKHMIELANEGTCLWCGHGRARDIAEIAYRRLAEQNVSPIFTSRPPDVRVVALRAARSHIWDEDACALAALAEEKRTGRFPRASDWQKAQIHGEHRPSYQTIHNRFGGWKAFKLYCADIPREAVAA